MKYYAWKTWNTLEALSVFAFGFFVLKLLSEIVTGNHLSIYHWNMMFLNCTFMLTAYGSYKRRGYLTVWVVIAIYLFIFLAPVPKDFGRVTVLVGLIVVAQTLILVVAPRLQDKGYFVGNWTQDLLA